MSPHQFQVTPALSREPRNYTPLSRDAAKEHLYAERILTFEDLLDEMAETVRERTERTVA